MHILIPVKQQLMAKSRLADVLAPSERRLFNQAMLRDVLNTSSECSGVNQIVLISDDPAAMRLGQHYSAEVFSERAAGARNLNQALEATCDHLVRQKADNVLILPGDMPLLRRADLNALFKHAGETPHNIVLSPDMNNDGTNAMLFMLARRPSLAYGKNSFVKHQNNMLRQGLEYSVFRRPGFAQDVDTVADLLRVFEQRDSRHCGRQTSKFLSQSDIRERLSAINLSESGRPKKACAVVND